MIASTAQLAAQFALSGVKTKRTKIVLKYEVIAAGVALLLMASAALKNKALSFIAFWQTGGSTVLFLFIAGYLFWRLADKHWRQIIGEQIVLV